MNTPTKPRRLYAVATLAAVGTLGLATAAGLVGSAHADDQPSVSEETQIGDLYPDRDSCVAALENYPVGKVVSSDAAAGTMTRIKTSRCLEYGEEGIQVGLRVTYETVPMA